MGAIDMFGLSNIGMSAAKFWSGAGAMYGHRAGDGAVGMSPLSTMLFGPQKRLGAAVSSFAMGGMFGGFGGGLASLGVPLWRIAGALLGAGSMGFPMGMMFGRPMRSQPTRNSGVHSPSSPMTSSSSPAANQPAAPAAAQAPQAEKSADESNKSEDKKDSGKDEKSASKSSKSKGSTKKGKTYPLLALQDDFKQKYPNGLPDNLARVKRTSKGFQIIISEKVWRGMKDENAQQKAKQRILDYANAHDKILTPKFPDSGVKSKGEEKVDATVAADVTKVRDNKTEAPQIIRDNYKIQVRPDGDKVKVTCTLKDSGSKVSTQWNEFKGAMGDGVDATVDFSDCP